MNKILIVVSFFCLTLFSAIPHSVAAEKVLVFAAASTTNMLDEVITLYNSKGGAVTASYAGSGTLARQIESGAPAAIFISANNEWMEYLEKASLVEKGTNIPLLGNTLVMVAPSDSSINIDLTKKPDIVKILNDSRLVIGSPASVPAGNYAKEAFIKLGMWDSLIKHLAEVENVRVALAFVSRKEAALGVVFGTDAAADKNVRVVAEFPTGSYSEINYPCAIVKGKANAEVKKFYDFLKSAEAKTIYKKYGFKAN